MISRSAQYALRALVHLAGASRLRTVEDLAGDTGIPVDYLAKILGQLCRAGVLSAQRGTGGGYRLLPDPASLTVASIVGIIDPPAAIPRCHGCERGGGTECGVHLFLAGITGEVDRRLAATTLGSLCGR